MRLFSTLSVSKLPRRTFRSASAAVLFLALIVGCASSDSYTPLINAEPDIGAVLERSPRTLRLFFKALPDVSRSNLTLLGPDGEYPLRGLHTMAADDLMIEITNPSVPPGDYTVRWSTVIEGDPNQYSGNYSFTVQGN